MAYLRAEAENTQDGSESMESVQTIMAACQWTEKLAFRVTQWLRMTI